MMKVAAIVVTYNRKQLLKECLNAILNQTAEVERIIVINNASTDGTEDLFKKNGEFASNKIKCVNMDCNTGGSGGFYEGFKRASKVDADWFWIMDDDTIPNYDCLEKLLEANDSLNKNEDYNTGKRKISFFASSIFGQKGEFMNVPNVDLAQSKNGYQSYYEHLGDNMIRIKDATFVSLLINSKAVYKCGLPCRDYFIWGDDGEYTLRLTKYYGEAYLVGCSVAIHKRIGAKKLEISNFEDINRIKMYHYYIRNNIINTIFYNKDKNLFITFSKKIIQATCSIKYIFTKHGLLKILIIWKGTVEGFLQYNKFKKYILEQIKII
ncbi:glycosyltransferase family 2 protein [Holdemania filiformis]|uniref:Glycosyltransferase, group 2 family protein n=1 Tax=Holdemania filiformis DSM 12042 TaxID=545696 RepID=B9Y8A3_9FIRM|nr:glycosyltransferase family 2 protein [Holdemania filiformis]EEF67787.1 glycosyltransferase, group 2 family protein [Holdemania filiformis DSM 12042]MCQ4953423.1 glycosyltransferase family 2 protein [Holdemania filiformis]